MHRVFHAFVTCVVIAAASPVHAGADAKAAELLAKARAAAGGENRLAAIHALAMTGTVVRMIGDRQVSGELSLQLELPNRFLRSETISPMGDATLIVTEQGLNGDTVLRGMRTINAPAGAVIRMPPPPAPGSDAELQALRNSRAELARLVIAWLLTAPAPQAMEFASGGEAESPDGKADVVDVTGADGFAMKLFLDRGTHRPLMIAYRGVAPRMIVQSAQHGAAPPDPQVQPPAHDVVDIQMFVDDYKAVDGVMLPHHMTRAMNGETIEEWTFTSVTVNPTFKPDTFTRR